MSHIYIRYELCHTCTHAMLNILTSEVTHIYMLGVMSHMYTRYAEYTHEWCHTYTYVTSHVTHTHTLCRIYSWVMSHIHTSNVLVLSHTLLKGEIRLQIFGSPNWRVSLSTLLWKLVWNSGDSRENLFESYGDSRKKLFEILAVVII